MPAALPRRARLVAYGLTVGMLVATWQEIEAWPVTAFHLFSRRRGPTVPEWELVALVDGAAVPVGRGHPRELPGLAGGSAERFCRVVVSWGQLPDLPGPDVTIRLAHLKRSIPRRDGEPARVVDRRVVRTERCAT